MQQQQGVQSTASKDVLHLVEAQVQRGTFFSTYQAANDPNYLFRMCLQE